MAIKRLTPVDIFNSLTPAEKRKALAILRKAEQSPCEAKGHSFKPVKQIKQGWLEVTTETYFVCTKCGKRIS